MLEPAGASRQLPLELSGERPSDWTVRMSRRARRLSVRVFRTGRVEVIVPPRASAATVEKFIGAHRGWIEKKRSEALRHAMPVEPFPPGNIELEACAERWRVHLSGGRGRPRVRMLAPGVLDLSGEACDTVAARQALRRWLMARAAETLAPWLAATAGELGFRYLKTAVRRQRSRWGSCSVRGTISLNACLLFQRPQVVRYLFIHELAHTVHLNHSKRFWHCVAQHCPDFERLDAELTEGWRRVPGWVFDSQA